MKSSAQSMTSYASLQLTTKDLNMELFLKSHNGKAFELKFKVPKQWSSLENWARKEVQKHAFRGHFELWVNIGQNAQSEKNHIKYLKALESALGDIKDISIEKIPHNARIQILNQNKELWFEDDSSTNFDEISQDIKKSISKLVLKSVESRQGEAELIIEKVKVYLSTIATSHTHVKKMLPDYIENLNSSYNERLRQFFKDNKDIEAFEKRLQSELVFLLEKKEVSEEIDRIEFFLKKADSVINHEKAEKAKELNFVMQELNREWTTLGNKLQSTDFFDTIKEAKLNIEKIREQILNLV